MIRPDLHPIRKNFMQWLDPHNGIKPPIFHG